MTNGRVQHYDTIVVGGGQAGLALGHYLAEEDVDFLIVDAEERVGDRWRSRWDSLRLFTPARYSSLPGMPFPDAPLSLPDKDQVADYLERYALRFDLPVRSRTEVTRLSKVGDPFVLETGSGSLEARNVVIATGPFQRPRVPALAGALAGSIHQLHSSSYRSPFDLPEGPVLVVGAANSGAQIALELSGSHEVTLAGRSVGHIPRAILGIDVFRWIWPLLDRLDSGTSLGRRLRARAGADALIGIGDRDFRTHRVRRVGPVTHAECGVPYADGVRLNARTIIWATGFSPDYGWVKLPVFGDDARPRHARGVTDVEGLYFLGLPFQHRRSSALIGGVGADAAFIASEILRRE